MKVGVSTVLREKNPHKLAALAVALCGLSPFLLWPRHRTKPISGIHRNLQVSQRPWLG